MPAEAPRYDVYLSFSPEDEAWVEQQLIPRLDTAGISFCVPRAMPLGPPIIANIEGAIKQSRKILLVLTPRWVASTWNQYESVLGALTDPDGALGRTIPVLVEPCDVPLRISSLDSANLTDTARREAEFNRIIAALRPAGKAPTVRGVFISYKHNAKPDAQLAAQLHRQLNESGHKVQIDRDLKVGQDWAKQIERMIETSDFVVVLLSEQSVLSEMMIKEVEHAYWHNQHTRKAKLLPVRVNYGGSLPHPLSTYLDKIQYIEWRSRTPDSTARLVAQLRDAIGFDDELPEASPVASPEAGSPPKQDDELPPPPLPYADPAFIASLSTPTGALAPQDQLYIEREADRTVLRQLAREQGVTIAIRAPRQMGKSSLLMRGMNYAESLGRKCIFINLQLLENF